MVHYDLSILQKDVTKLKNIDVFLCCYGIFNQKINPFLSYLLYKYKDTSLMSFLKLHINSNIKGEIHTFFMKNVGMSPQIMGFKKHNGKVYVICFLNFKYLIQNEYLKKRELWWTTIHEICNQRRLMMFNIHHSVYDFFYSYPSLIYLMDANKRRLTIPRIGYYGCNVKLMSYVSALGIQQSEYTPFGNFYYFNTFTRAVKYGGWDYSPDKEVSVDKHNRVDKGGIVRFAVFLNNNRMLLNHPQDPKTTFNKDNDTDFISMYKKYPRMVDPNGDWAKDNDTLYVGVLLDKEYNERFHRKTREQYITKKSSDYTALSSHIIDKETLGDVWDENDTYGIK